MKTFLLNLIALILMTSSPSIMYGQFQKTSSKFKGKYKEYLKPDEKEVKSYYHYVVSKNSNKEYILRIFYPEKPQLVSETIYTSKKLNKKQGLERKWNERGEKTSEGTYLNNKKNGKWIKYRHGKIMLEENYKSGKKHGIYKKYDSDERLRSEVNYVNGTKEGSFVRYDTLGSITNEGIYKADTVFQQKNKPAKIKRNKKNMPSFVACQDITDKNEQRMCSDTKLLQYVQSNIRYPKLAQKYGIEGVTVVQFIVNTDGTISDIKCLQGICKSLEEEAIRVTNMLPKWNPAIEDGKPVSSVYHLPIRFKLN